MASGNVRAGVHIADPRRESGMRKRLREQIRRNERRGWRVAAEPGADAEPADRAAFERAYAETMARTGASERYLYPPEYFERLLAAEPAWLLAGRARGRGRQRRRDRGHAATATCITSSAAPATTPSRTRR